MKSNQNFIFLAISIIAMAFLANQTWMTLERRSLEVADQARLRSTYDRWREFSLSPSNSVERFIQGKGYLTANTQIFSIRGTNYSGLFAITNPLSGELGTWVITTNKILIWAPKKGEPRIVNYSY